MRRTSDAAYAGTDLTEHLCGLLGDLPRGLSDFLLVTGRLLVRLSELSSLMELLPMGSWT